MSNTEYKLSNEQKTQLAAAWFAKDGDGDVSHRKALALIEAIEAATAAKYAERIAELEQDVHNLNWALGTEGYETMATPEQQAEADKAHAETMERIAAMKRRADYINGLEATVAELQAKLDAAAVDAERYRFIRDADRSDCITYEIGLYAMESLDEYVDAAMEGEANLDAMRTGEPKV